MISKKNYNILKKKYGKVASWAIWSTDYTEEHPKMNTADLSVFRNNELLDILNTGYVFVGLNASSTHGDVSQGTDAWYNFHSNYAYQNDFKLRFALQGTKYWGSYITDLIKYYEEVESGKVESYLRKNPAVVEKNINDFKSEIALLGNKPVLVALGTATYKLLDKYLGDEYEIKMIKHYSYTIGKEAYRREVKAVLDK